MQSVSLLTRTCLHSAGGLAAAVAAASASTVYAQDARELTGDEQSGEQGDAIVVVGSRATNRTEQTSPVPIDVFTGEELAAKGAQDLATALRQVAPSLNFNGDAFGGTAVPGRPATLRGLGPDQILVLINGKRRHANAVINTNNVIGRGSAAVDLNLVPIMAVQRVEVLRDGAAAQYGSDAIAGVINIVLKDASEGGLIAFQAGVTEEGDGEYGQFQANIGVPIFEGGFLNLSTDLRLSNDTNRAILDTFGDATINPNFGQRTSRFGTPRQNSATFSANLGVPLSDSVDLEAFGTFAYQNYNTAGFFRGPFSFLFPAEDGGTQFPNGYLPQAEGELLDAQLSANFVGTSGDWDWEFGATFGINDLSPRIIETIDPTLVPNSPTEFDLPGFTYTQFIVDGLAVREFDALSGVTWTLGAGYRRETYRINTLAPGVATVGGAGFLGASDEARDSINLFTELNVNVTDTLTIDLAGRYEDYSDFGDQFTGKASALFRPTDFIGFRGSVSTGFRAPSLQQQFFNSAEARTTGAGMIVEQGLFPVDNPTAIAVGATPLEAETSLQFSAGITLNLFDGLFITVDYFNTDIDDRIVLSETLEGPEVDAALAAAGITSADAVQFFTNAVDTTTEGFEVVANYNTALPWDADVSFTLGYVDFDTTIDSIRANPATPSLSLFDTRSQIFLTRGQPEERGNFNVSYNQGGFTLDAGANYFGSYETLFATVFEFGEEVTFDLALGYDVTNSFNIRVGVNNLSNEFPDRFQDQATGGLLTAINSLGIQFPVEAAFGTRGREYFARLQYQF